MVFHIFLAGLFEALLASVIVESGFLSRKLDNCPNDVRPDRAAPANLNLTLPDSNDANFTRAYKTISEFGARVDTPVAPGACVDVDPYGNPIGLEITSPT